MRQTHRGLLLPRRASAFTMIEVLVVILIIGIIINFVVVRVGHKNPLDELKVEARRFTSLLELASEEALLRSELIGVIVKEDAYLFMVLDEESWIPIQETVFRERTLPASFRLKILTEQPMEDQSDSETQTPDIILLPSGEITPFEVKVSSDLSEDFFRISGAETGILQLDHVSPYE